MLEDQAPRATPPTSQRSACPHPEAVGARWGDDISAERQADLQATLDAWNAPGAEHGDRIGPFSGVTLTGADVSWLAERLRLGAKGSIGPVRDLHLEGANLTEAHLEGALLAEVHLEHATLRGAHLMGAYLPGAYLEWADLTMAHMQRAFCGGTHFELATLGETQMEHAVLYGVHFEGANLGGVHLAGTLLVGVFLEGATLVKAHLEGATLANVHLEGAHLREAHLEGAALVTAHLEGAYLDAAHLEGADLTEAHLEARTYDARDAGWLRVRQTFPRFPITLPPARLNEAFLNNATQLRNATLWTRQSAQTARGAGPTVADVRWGGANLAVLDWTHFTEHGVLLGDERQARDWRAKRYVEPEELKKESLRNRMLAASAHTLQQRRERLDIWAAAARANRQLATALRAQGMSDEADHFAYRAQVCQRRLLWYRRKPWQALFSRFLDVLAGYGYKPERTLVMYALAITLFAALYLLISHGIVGFGMPTAGVKPLLWYQAIILSISAFHGRGFFQELPGDPVALCAAIEAICGLIIEISFIATFTQRFFGSGK